MSMIQDKVVLCRKRHRCCWCGEWCEAGKKAFYRAYKFDGEFQTDYMHPECRDAASKADIDPAEGFEEGSMMRGKPVPMAGY